MSRTFLRECNNKDIIICIIAILGTFKDMYRDPILGIANMAGITWSINSMYNVE